MSDIQQSILDEQDNYSTNNTAVLSTLEVICPPQQQKSTIQTLTDNFDSDTSYEFRQVNNGNRGPILAKNEQTYRNLMAVVPEELYS